MRPYILITPAFNEQHYLQATIESLLVQTLRPVVWVIVDDGSTDQTAEIIKRYAKDHPWIHYLYRAKEPGQTYFGSNVYAILEGLKQVQNTAYDYLAILDADISLPTDYYERIFQRMEKDERLGIASGVYQDNINGTLRKVLNDRRSTPKALMVFRRQCFQEIGGFVPMKYGGEDTVACFTARMKNWKTWSFPDLIAVHNKPVGTGHSKGYAKIRFHHGVCEYFLATHFLFLIVKSMRRSLKESPFLLSGFLRLAGYVYAHFKRESRQISPEVVHYIRAEQFRRVLSGNKVPDNLKVNETH